MPPIDFPSGTCCTGPRRRAEPVNVAADRGATDPFAGFQWRNGTRQSRTPVLHTAVVASSHFTITSNREPAGVLRVSLTGEFDMGVGDALANGLREAAHQPATVRVVVDLEHTRFIDSHTIAGLVTGYEAATSARLEFTVVN